MEWGGRGEETRIGGVRRRGSLESCVTRESDLVRRGSVYRRRGVGTLGGIYKRGQTGRVGGVDFIWADNKIKSQMTNKRSVMKYVQFHKLSNIKQTGTWFGICSVSNDCPRR